MAKQQLWLVLTRAVVLVLFILGAVAASPEEAFTLLRFKEGLVGADTVLTRWSSRNAASVCSWEGVMCSYTGSTPDLGLTVVGLDLTSFNLNGTITPPLCDLPNLSLLLLSNNSFNQSFPSWLLDSCSLLYALDLSENRFWGPLPSNISKLSHLQILVLTSNFLSGPIPPNLCKGASLGFLDLANNQLTGSVPRELWTQPNLQFLDLHNNNLSGHLSIPTHLLRLRYLNLSNNKLNGTLPLQSIPSMEALILNDNLFEGNVLNLDTRSSSNCNSLKTLLLSNNKFNGSIPPALGLCSQLVIIRIEDNLLTGEIPKELRNLQNLTTLALNGNRLTGTLPTFLSNSSSLMFLDISKNKLHGTLEDCWLCSLSNLKVLSLAYNSNIGGNLPPCLANFFKHLLVVDISNCNFSGAIPDDWKLQKSPNDNGSYVESSVYFETTWLPPIPEMEPGRFDEGIDIATKHLDLQYTYISLAEKSLDFSGNQLAGSIPPSLGSLEGLKSLNLSRNNLQGFIPIELANSHALESFDMSCNNLTGPIPSQFTQLTSLSSFNVSYNDLAGPIPQGNQFSTFDESSYLGNSGLCGFPLRKLQCDNRTSTPVPTNSNVTHITLLDHMKEVMEIDGLIVGFVVGFVGVLVIDFGIFLKTGRNMLTIKLGRQ